MRGSAPALGVALALALLASAAEAADPYVVDLARALREFGNRVGIPVFVIHDIGAKHHRQFLRVWRDLGIAQDHGFGSPVGEHFATDREWLDRQAAAMAAAMGQELDAGRPGTDAGCSQPPPWTPPRRPGGWQPTPRTWVRQLQQALKARGHYRDAVDGLFGPGTRAAVYDYQCHEGLPSEGVTRRAAAALGIALPR